MRNYGLLGNNLKHSFSKEFFEKKIKKENIRNCKYQNYETKRLNNIKSLISKNKISGLNITIPYKSAVIPYLDYLDEEAKEIGSINTIKVINKKLYGYNTDAIGFKKSITPIIKKRNTALVLGDGGSSKAVQFVLRKINCRFIVINRNGKFNYDNITKEMMKNSDIIINTTPLGTYPEIKKSPKIPYHYLTPKHLLYDLVYNPATTKFLGEGKNHSSETKNGLEMLQIQAEFSWKIWHSDITEIHKFVRL